MESFRLNQHIYCVPKDEFERTRDELCEMLNVTNLLGRPVRELSLGERMKMELIAALIHKPDVLFLDEPTIGLDVVAQTQNSGISESVSTGTKQYNFAYQPLHERYRSTL